MKIAVVGLGYVGLSIATLLSQNHEVVGLDIDTNKVEMINKKISPIVDEKISHFFDTKKLNLIATTSKEDAYKGAAFIIIATPTNYCNEDECFDTSLVETVIKDVLDVNPNAQMVIKSTVPIGYTLEIKDKYPNANIFFSPEFLREGKALHDNLYPSRIVVGEDSKMAHLFTKLLQEGAKKINIPTLFTNNTEAEAIKLFSNTYLAMRVSFFNELDTYAETKKLNSKNIINGLGLDPRIGDYYNNPSFGYGGYCLPKDSKQLLASYKDVPNELIRATVESNKTRKKFIINQILSYNPKVVGIYRLTMKKDSDNFRFSAIQEIMTGLKKNGIEIIVYEPGLDLSQCWGFEVIKNLTSFKERSNIIVSNRMDENIIDVSNKVYTRDLFHRD